MKLHEKFKTASTDRVLGVTSVDLFVPRLNFVFGEAQCPGKIALISLYRLRPEFYGDAPNRSLFFERAEKEAVHELGHTLGLRHCEDSSCVMFFSTSIVDTDAKDSTLCGKCAQRLKSNVRRLDLEG
jgi:archaemetzincin